MRTLKLSLFLLVMAVRQMSAQAPVPATLKMESNPRPWGNDDLSRLAGFCNVDYQKATFSGPGLKGKNYYIVSKEIWKGKITKTDTIYKSGSNAFFKPVQSDTLKFAIMGGRRPNKKLTAEFIFDRFSTIADFDCADTDDYSLRVLDRAQPIEIGKPFYAFAYILPYEKDGYKYYCAVEASGKDIEKWGTEFNIEHYVLFEMKFY